MKFFHMSDLHIGKQLHGYNLKADQVHILTEVVTLAAQQHPDAIVIAGDIYDKSVPSAEAVSIFDTFLTHISEIEPIIPVIMIAGNHDSPERIQYAGAILNRHHIHIAGLPPRNLDEFLSKVTLKDLEGEVDFYLLPFMKPSYVKGIFPEEMPETYEDAVAKIVEREAVDTNKRNVLVTHQFYTGGTRETKVCDSETFHIGGLESIRADVICQFDYAALGHIHGAQEIGSSRIQYCGTLLKYSVSEQYHKKGIRVVTLGKKGEEPSVEVLPLHPLRDVKKLSGTLEEIMAMGKERDEDYVSIVLTDEKDPYRPKEQLQRVYPHILEIRLDNARTRQRLSQEEEEIKIEDPLTMFAHFYRDIQGRELEAEELEIVCDVLETVKEV